MLLALRGGLRAEGTSVPLEVALAFAGHCRVEEEASLRLDVLERAWRYYGGREGENKVVVGLRSGMKQVARVFIVRWRREPIVVCSIFAGVRWSAEREKCHRLCNIPHLFERIAFQCQRHFSSFLSHQHPPLTEPSQYVRPLLH